MLVGTDLKEIKYVAVEVVKSGTSKAAEVQCGLFMGICRKKDNQNIYQKFLVLMVSENSVRMYNLNTYNIVTIDTTDAASRYMTVFLNEAADQKEAIKLLDELTDVLKSENKLYVNDPNDELVNIENYKDYPETALLSDNLTGDTTDSTSTGTTDTTKSTSTTQNNAATKPSLTIIKRKGRLPLPTTLAAMRERVLQIAEGTFKVKALPIPACDVEEERKEKEEEKKMNQQASHY